MSRVRHTDDGFTLVELLVAMVVAFVLVGVSMSVVVGSQDVVTTTKRQQDMNEEARQALNRMARDLRQASRIVTAVNPDGPSFSTSGLVAVRFASDFDGDGCIGGSAPNPAPDPPPTCLPANAGNPEDITYCFQPGINQVFIIDNKAAAVTPVSSTSTSCDGGQPLLAGNVSGLHVEYRSNQYRYDGDPLDGVTTWRELDAALPPVGNANGALDVELSEVDAVVLNIRMQIEGRTQTYRTQVDLRNRSR